MPTVLTVGGHDDDLFKVGDFWKMELKKSICFKESKTPPSSKEKKSQVPHKQMLDPRLQETGLVFTNMKAWPQRSPGV